MICEIYEYYGTRTLNSKAPQIESPHKRYVWFFSLERPGPFIAGRGLRDSAWELSGTHHLMKCEATMKVKSLRKADNSYELILSKNVQVLASIENNLEKNTELN